MNPVQVIFRVDANARIGLGHLTRCLALADMLAPDFSSRFVLREPPAGVLEQLKQAGFVGQAVPAGLALTDEPGWLLAQCDPPDILVLDGYTFSAAYQQQFRQRPQALVYLDDLVDQYMWADTVLNQAGGVAVADYRAAPGTMFYLGPRYALLRPPFQDAALLEDVSTSDRVFLNMGGADPDNHTLRVLGQLRQWLPQHQFEVVTGSAYPHLAALVAAVATAPNVRLHHNLNATQMAALLRTCGLKVCPPSGVAYECCAVGGLVLLHPTADNQRQFFAYLTENALAFPLTSLPNIPPEQLPALALEQQQRQRAVFDGQAGQRLRQAFQQLALAYRLTMRRATAADVRQYFDWANDADVRHNAIHPESIGWESHQAWFTHRLADPDSLLYHFEEADRPVGQVRVEFTDSEGIIDYSVAAEHRGRGLGLAILRRTLRALHIDRPGSWVLIAQVKAGNLSSRRVFERLGFVPQPATELHGAIYEIFRLALTPP